MARIASNPVTSLTFAFLAGLVGGAHCLGMCGGFVVAAAAGGARAWLFHVGRLAGYAVLGALAAVAGALLDLGGTAAGVHRLRYVFAGAVLLAFALAFLGALPRRWLEPGAGAVAGLLVRLRRRGGRSFPLLLGLPIGLLPCGLLYPMYAAAAATGSALQGAGVLLAFGAGTLPWLGTFSFALDRIGVATRQRLMRVAGIALLAFAGLMLWRGIRGAPHHPREHGAAEQPAP
jgi:sulfite exporter TauE/SafE